MGYYTAFLKFLLWLAFILVVLAPLVLVLGDLVEKIPE